MPDQQRWNCADEVMGQRCARLGVYTSSTQGSERWYCEDHYPPFANWRAGKRTAPTAAFHTIKAKLRPIAEILDEEALAERQAITHEPAYASSSLR
jgi:hypothetical protein